MNDFLDVLSAIYSADGNVAAQKVIFLSNERREPFGARPKTRVVHIQSLANYVMQFGRRRLLSAYNWRERATATITSSTIVCQ